MSVPPSVRRLVADRSHPDLPVIDVRAVLAGGLGAALLYVLLVAWVLPGTADIVAALPVGARIGVLLLASTATRFVAGWLCARSYRSRHGLPERVVALPSAAVGGVLGFLVVTALATLGGGPTSAGVVLVDLVRWSVESMVGALLALPGSRAGDGRHAHLPRPTTGRRSMPTTGPRSMPTTGPRSMTRTSRR